MTKITRKTYDKFIDSLRIYGKSPTDGYYFGYYSSENCWIEYCCGTIRRFNTFEDLKNRKPRKNE